MEENLNIAITINAIIKVNENESYVKSLTKIFSADYKIKDVINWIKAQNVNSNLNIIDTQIGLYKSVKW